MSGIQNHPLLNNIAGDASSPDAAQDEQAAAASGQVQGQGVAPQIPVGSATPAANAAGAKDGASQIGSITQGQRNAIGGSLPRTFGPTLPAAPSQAAQGYQSQQTQLNNMKSDATAVATHLESPQGEPSQAELMNTLSKALNNEYRTSFEANRIAGLASVNAKQAEVKDTLDEVHGERIHAAEQLGAAFGATATQGLTALKGASLMGSMGSEKSQATNKSALNKADDKVEEGRANGPHGPENGPAADNEVAATRSEQLDLHRSQDARHIESTHARAAQNESERSSMDAEGSRSGSDTRSVNTAHEDRQALFDRSAERASEKIEMSPSRTPRGGHENDASLSRPRSDSEGTKTTIRSDQIPKRRTPTSGQSKRAMMDQEAIALTKGSDAKSDTTLATFDKRAADAKEPSLTGDISSTSDGSSKVSRHNARRTMSNTEMRGEALKAAAQGLGSIVQNSADLIDKMAGGQHEADQAKVAQKQDQVNAQVAQNNQEMAKGNKEQTSEAIKNMYQAMVTAIQRKQDMMSQIAGR